MQKSVKILTLLFLFVLVSFFSLTHAATFGVSPTKTLQSGLVGYWTLDGKDTVWTSSSAATTLDKSGNGKTGTLTSMTQSIATVAGKIGQGLNFDGTNDYVSVGNVSSSVKTVAFWMKTTNTTKKIIDLNATATIEVSSGTITANSFTSPTIYVNGAVTSTVAANIWYYVTITTGTDINASAVDIGRISSGYFPGVLDDVRMYSRALSAAEVEQLYKIGIAKFSVSPTKTLQSGLVGYWTLDGKDTIWTSSSAATTLDKSGGGNTGTLGSMTQSIATVAGKIGQGLNFDGTNDYVAIGDVLDLVGNDLTLAGWFNIKTCTNNGGGIVKLSAAGNYRLITDNFGCVMEFGIRNTANTFQTFNSLGNLSLNKWVHVVATLVDATGSAVIYIDGVQNNTNTFTITRGDTAQPLEIGRNSNNSTFFNGPIDDVRIYNRALTAAEVMQLYNTTR
ncbi:hypothetical protein EXS45_01190 [Candidatus Nomurabacteria bacterium]|nr:hypothetical protein [Candidatus Nomurabacteria bacterium]